MDALRRGDTRAFEELYRRHAARLYNLAFRMAGRAADAEDLLQEIFLQAHRKLASFKGESAVGTWLYRLAMNLCLDHLRSRQTRAASVTDSLEETGESERRLGRYSPGDMAPTRLDLEKAIAMLPEGCRAAFLLHDVEGFDHAEVASILGIAEGTSKSQVHKARLRLRAALTGETEA